MVTTNAFENWLTCKTYSNMNKISSIPNLYYFNLSFIKFLIIHVSLPEVLWKLH